MTATSPALDGLRLIDDALRGRLIAELAAGFTGELIGPDSPGYNSARRVWNAMVDKRPGLIARCASTGDVVRAVDAARRHRLLLAVRGGGHSVAGHAHADGGLTIDLSGMRRVEVDTGRRVVHAGGGCLLADVDEATAAHGLVVPMGVVSETGLGGLALGGGLGWLTRRFGLTCDNVVSLEVVLASGEVVEASPARHPDLFWALRGGSGNFGVVTRFSLRAHRFGPTMRMGVALYRPEDAGQALREYAREVPALPRTIGWHAALKRRMPPLSFVPEDLVGDRTLMLISMWLGEADDPDGIRRLERLNNAGNPCGTAMTVLPFGGGVQRMLDAEFAPGHRYYMKETHLTGLPDGVIDTILDFWVAMPMDGELEIVSFGGAMTDTAEEDAAFANRHHPWWLMFATHWDDSAHDNDHIAGVREAIRRLGPHSGTGAYVNNLNVDENDRIVDAYGGPENYARLRRIKARYDPDNLFRVNANIAPVGPAASCRLST